MHQIIILLFYKLCPSINFFVCLFRKGSNKKMLLLHLCLMQEILNRSGLVIYCPTWQEIYTKFYSEQLFNQMYLTGLVNRKLLQTQT